jgi:AcrR family transcriptional regulator
LDQAQPPPRHPAVPRVDFTDLACLEGTRGRSWEIVEAMIEVVIERGFADTSVKLVAARARVSVRTFHELFATLEDCMTAVLETGFEVSRALIRGAFARQARWQDAVREALTSLLVFFDAEPQLTRMWFVEIMTVGRWALEHHERSLTALIEVIVGTHDAFPPAAADPHQSTGVMAAVLGVIKTHVFAKSHEPLIGLLGPLIGLVVTPLLDPAGVAEEVARGEADARALLAGVYPPAGPLREQRPAPLPDLLAAPNAHRARACVHYVAKFPGATNRQVADGIGVSHLGQVSALLGRLRGLGLLEKSSGGAGYPNAWAVTPIGAQVVSTLRGTHTR